jgi:hypothetical protein
VVDDGQQRRSIHGVVIADVVASHVPGSDDRDTNWVRRHEGNFY